MSGIATTIRRARGGNVLTLTNFEVDNGRVRVQDFEDLGALTGNRGDQQLPRGLDLGRYATVLIW